MRPPKAVGAVIEVAEFRREVQGMRALAVALVLVYHYAPALCPGGFVGVDVFFVLSGYLITRILVREVLATGSVRYLAFLQRRVLRLLPAAMLVVFVCVCASALWAAPVHWPQLADAALAAMLYVQNWNLVRLSADYLAAERAPSVPWHFGSLAVEEQFYLVWPLFVLLGHRLWRKHPRALPWALAVLLCFATGASVCETNADPQRAYFSTFARAFEFLLGAGALALQSRMQGHAVSAIVASAGAVTVVLSAFVIDPSCAFPGPWALLPCMATAVFLACGRSNVGVGRVLASGPLCRLGGLSYSLYLWHLPMGLWAERALRDHADMAWFPLVPTVTSLIAATLTKRLVEDPIRHGAWRSSGRLALALALGSLALGLSSQRGLGLAASAVQARVGSADDAASQALRARFDRPAITRRPCYVRPPGVEPLECTFGDPEGTRDLVVFGDSHAAMWLPALDAIGLVHGVRVRTLVKTECPPADVVSQRRHEAFPECDAWRAAALERLRVSPPDGVIVSQFRLHRSLGDDAGTVESTVRGVVRMLQALRGMGTEVVVLQDIPHPGVDVPECVAEAESRAMRCGIDARVGRQAQDPLTLARGRVAGVAFVDPTHWFCQGGHCPVIVDGLVVYRDRHHMTASYARELTAPLARELARSLSWFDLPAP